MKTKKVRNTLLIILTTISMLGLAQDSLFVQKIIVDTTSKIDFYKMGYNDAKPTDKLSNQLAVETFFSSVVFPPFGVIIGLSDSKKLKKIKLTQQLGELKHKDYLAYERGYKKRVRRKNIPKLLLSCVIGSAIHAAAIFGSGLVSINPESGISIAPIIY